MRQQTYFRVQAPDRDVTDLLDLGMQVSSAWHREDLDREGVSVCSSREELAEYLGTKGDGIPFGSGGWVLVELAGYRSAATPLDGEFGELLIHPTEIVSVVPMDDDFFDMIGAAYEAAQEVW